jgi:hypothetical protein
VSHLAPYQAVLLRHYFESLGSEGSADFIDFPFATGDLGMGLVVRVARIEMPCSDGSTLWFNGTLTGPQETTSDAVQFVGIFDSDAPSLSELIATAGHYHSRVSALRIGDTVPLGPGSLLRGAGYRAFVVIEPDVYSFFASTESSILGVPTRLAAVLPIDAAELEVKKTKGLEALYEVWENTQRDLLAVVSPTVS